MASSAARRVEARGSQGSSRKRTRAICVAIRATTTRGASAGRAGGPARHRGALDLCSRSSRPTLFTRRPPRGSDLVLASNRRAEIDGLSNPETRAFLRCFLACLAGKHIIVATTVTAHGRDVGRGGAPRGGHPGIRGGGQHEGPGEHASHAGARGHQGGAPVSSRRARVHRRGRGFVAQAVAAVERARALVPGVERRRVVRAVVGENDETSNDSFSTRRRALEPGDSPAGPAFVKIILPRHVGPEGRLPAPAGLADFLPPTARSLALVCDGESWRCTWSVGRDAAGASLAGNWRGFAEDQRLEPGDAVTLKKEAGATLRVTIHRARVSGALSRDAPGSFYDASCVKTRGEKDRRTHGTKTNEAGGLNRAFRARAGWIAAFAEAAAATDALFAHHGAKPGAAVVDAGATASRARGTGPTPPRTRTRDARAGRAIAVAPSAMARGTRTETKGNRNRRNRRFFPRKPFPRRRTRRCRRRIARRIPPTRYS